MLLVFSLCLSLLFGKSLGAPASDGTTRELDQTPTWAVAGVCAIMIFISIALEKLLHKVGTVCLFFFIFLIVKLSDSWFLSVQIVSASLCSF